MAEPTGPLAGLTPQDQKLVLGAFKSLKNGHDVSFPTLIFEVSVMLDLYIYFVCHNGNVAV
jgi:hypothetical protein